jgi:hypothetical protein
MAAEAKTPSLAEVRSTRTPLSPSSRLVHRTSRSVLRDPVGTDLAGAPPDLAPCGSSGYARRSDLGLLVVGTICLPLLIPKWRVVDLVGFLGLVCVDVQGFELRRNIRLPAASFDFVW